MKAKLFTAIISTSLLLSACGGHNHPKAVDKLEEAKSNAIANAPNAEEIRCDDHGQPTMGNIGGATGTAPTTTETTPEAEPKATDEAPQTNTTADATDTQQ